MTSHKPRIYPLHLWTAKIHKQRISFGATVSSISSVGGLHVQPEETMVSYDVTSLFTFIPTTEAIEAIKKCLLLDNNLLERTVLRVTQMCPLLDLCLITIYFQTDRLSTGRNMIVPRVHQPSTSHRRQYVHGRS